MLNVKSIADKSGLSVNSVYKALAGSPGSSEKTKQLIRSIVKEMGFASCDDVYMRKRDKQAKGSGVENSLMAFVVLGTHLPVSLLLIRGMESVLAEQKIKLIVTYLPDYAALLEFLSSQKMAGVILDGFNYPEPSAAEIEALRRYPAAWVMDHGDLAGDMVTSDNGLIAKTAVDYFYEKGYSRLAFLIPEPGHLAFENEVRYFVKLSARRNLSVSVLTIPQLDRDPFTEVLPRCLDELAALSPLPQGLYVPKDLYAGAVYSHLGTRGIVPGRDIEVLTSGCSPEYLQGLSPQPLQIDINIEEIGRQVTRQMLWRKAHLDDPMRRIVMVPPTFCKSIIRELPQHRKNSA